MNNELRVFENAEFGSVRTVEIENEVYFIGKDVAEILGYLNTATCERQSEIMLKMKIS